MEDKCGYCLYEIDGKLQHITEASESNSPTYCSMQWSDKKYVGFGTFHSSFVKPSQYSYPYDPYI